MTHVFIYHRRSIGVKTLLSALQLLKARIRRNFLNNARSRAWATASQWTSNIYQICNTQPSECIQYNDIAPTPGMDAGRVEGRDALLINHDRGLWAGYPRISTTMGRSTSGCRRPDKIILDQSRRPKARWGLLMLSSKS